MSAQARHMSCRTWRYPARPAERGLLPVNPTESGASPLQGWLIVAAMTTCQALVLFDITAVGVALPNMTVDLDLSPSGAAWLVNAYLVSYTALVALGGRLADEWQRYRVFLLGVLLFVMGSAACGLTPSGTFLSEPWIIAFRALQGMGGALMVPAALAIVISSVPAESRGRAMSVYIGGGQVFFVLGPVAGGFLTQHISWRAIFFVAVPVAAAGAALLVAVMRSAVAARPRGAATVRSGTLAMVAGMALAMLGLQQAGHSGWREGHPVVLLAAGLAAMAWFVASERGAARPLLPLELFRDDAFRRYAATLFLLQVATVGLITFAPLLLQRGFGLTPSTAGIVMLAFIGGWAAMVPVAGILHDRFGPRRPIAIGALVAMVSLAAWTWSLTELTVALQIPFMALTGVGIGLSILPANTAAVTAGDASRRAATVGLVQTMRQLGGCTSIAVLSVFFLAAPSSAPTSLVAMAQTGFLILLAVVAVNVAINIRNGRAAAAP